MNTKIDYIYRDASNYKVTNSCIVAGEITKEQIDTILSSLEGGEYSIPSLVGLPEVRFENYDPEVDHPFFELGEYSFTLTSASTDVDFDIETLVNEFEVYAGDWEDAAIDVEAHLLVNSEKSESSTNDGLKKDEPVRILAYVRCAVDKEQLLDVSTCDDVLEDVEQELHWLEDSGMNPELMAVTVTGKDESPMRRYCRYLFDFASHHMDDKYPSTPMSYREFTE